MKFKTKNLMFNRILKATSGRYYGREIATFTIEEMRKLQSIVDRAWNSSGKNEMIREEYLELRRDLMKNLQQRGGV